MKSRTVITNGRLVLPDRIILNGEVVVEDGFITHLGRRSDQRITPMDITIDADGGYIMPGMIDLHSDAIEKELEPRPGAIIDAELAFSELEKKIAGQGITTMYHSFSFAGAEWGVREDKTAAETVRRVVYMANRRSLIRNCIHLRFEVTNYPGIATVTSLVREGLIDLISFMDHTPGQGQYPTLDDYRRYMEKTYHLPFSDIQKVLEEKEQWRGKTEEAVEKLVEAAKAVDIPMASHDDDHPGRLEYFRERGVTIHEFPVNLDTAKAARESGGDVCVGAPNVLREGSSGRGMRAYDAVVNQAANILCSDYYPPSMLHSVFKLSQETMTLPEAVAMATREPARAMGLNLLGSLEVGKIGDLIVVNQREGLPVVMNSVVAGAPVYGINYRRHSMLPAAVKLA
ncbi:MAG: alpha-D-ribose 1-methylphosphonate 5-triphosphate diphosphatase [Firmicutes bacterium]|nr:alpha-D-ribose 1-methylphosphonate 5-triphosphate diphosphatase [Bacillota bacterium]